MKGLFLATAGVFLILLASEWLWRKKHIRDELARKFVHILVGTFVAFWPLFMSWQQIELMSLALLAGVMISMQLNVFKAVHGVSRQTMGEVFFPVGIGLAAFFSHTPIIFTAAILHLSLADGLAAVIGKTFGFRHLYKVNGHRKSLAGSLMFLLTSMVIILGVVLHVDIPITGAVLAVMLLLPVAATVLENVAVAGTDNLLVPLLVIIVLRAVGI